MEAVSTKLQTALQQLLALQDNVALTGLVTRLACFTTAALDLHLSIALARSSNAKQLPTRAL